MVNRSPLSFAILMHLIIVHFFLIINFRFMIPNFGILIQPVPDYPSKNQIFRMVCRLFNGKLVSSTLLDRVRHVSFLIRSRICFIFSRIITKKTKLSPSPIKNKHTNNFFSSRYYSYITYYISVGIKIFFFWKII